MVAQYTTIKTSHM